MKNILTSFLGQNVANKTLVQFSNSWTMYLVSVLRYGGSKMENTRKFRFFKNSFQKNPLSRFFLNFFRRKRSRGSCVTFSENMLSISLLGFEKFASRLKSWHMSRNLRIKNITIWAPRKAGAPNIRINNIQFGKLHSFDT